MFSPQIPPVGSTFFPLAKMGPKTPKLGTSEVCFPPKSPPVGSPIFHWPKWVKKTQIWALLRCISPQTPHIGSANTTSWVYHFSLAKMGPKTPNLGTFGVFSPQIPPVESTFFPLAKMGQKIPKLGTFGVCFPPKSPPVGSPFFPLAKNGSKNPKFGHFWGVFSPQTPNIGSPNITGWLYHLSLAKMGQKKPKIGYF